MLTNLFYYNHYKPYFIKQSNAPKQRLMRHFYAQSTTNGYEEDTYPRPVVSVALNRALKNDVVDYAKQLTTNLVALKEATSQLEKTLAHFYTNLQKQGFEEARYWLKNDVNLFAKAYNNAATFAAGQEHSKPLQAFAKDQNQLVSQNKDLFYMLGISWQENECFEIGESPTYANRTRYTKQESLAHKAHMETPTMQKKLSAIQSVFQAINNATNSIMEKPLSEHMYFKGLGYYYNYHINKAQNSTFTLIQSGMLMDIVL